jgi:hypothetical protein
MRPAGRRRGLSGRAALFLVGCALHSGCAPEGADDYAKKLRAGMTVGEVESALGPGEVVAFDRLPSFYRDSIAPRGEGVSYRRWIKKSGGTTVTIVVPFTDGKAGDAFTEQAGPMRSAP